MAVATRAHTNGQTTVTPPARRNRRQQHHNGALWRADTMCERALGITEPLPAALPQTATAFSCPAHASVAPEATR